MAAVAAGLPPRLDADGFYAAVGGQARYDIRDELDYELCRIAALNCAVTDPKRPGWVLKGGFAIRHTYASDRLSADVDLAPMGMRTRGAGAIDRPPELHLDRVEPWRKSDRHHYSFPYIVGNGRGRVYSDVNVERPVRLPPPQKRDFVCKFMAPFEVWVACIEEIVGEKANGLLSFQYDDFDRIKDAFDLWYLLSNHHADTIDKEVLRRFLGTLRVTDEVRCPTTGLGAMFGVVLGTPEARLWWGRTVRPQLRGPARVDFDTVRNALPRLAQQILV